MQPLHPSAALPPDPLLAWQLLELAGGRVVVALEGGYNLSSIAASYAACTAVLLGDPPMPDWPARYPRQLKEETRPLLEEIRAILGPHWSALRAPPSDPLSTPSSPSPPPAGMVRAVTDPPALADAEERPYSDPPLDSLEEGPHPAGPSVPAVQQSYVWYAAYGSNLLEGRMLCYIQGGRVSSGSTGGGSCV